ncbi:MAG: protein-(glutamine-N5) methyltransferase, release factor-specific [Rhodospirillales bacterium 20-64-7]|nr:MAG: protein-(glutamine-N5) methyltransferase, release factor-specific [Rhodospirillales bacterium 20-64-7]
MTIAEALAAITARLAAVGIEEPRREARILLAAALRLDAAGLLLRDTVEPAEFEPMLARRAAREPLAYVIGTREFWGLRFAVSPATLIPRPDSETVVEAALAACPAPARVLDLGTGTGCLLLAVLQERQAAFGIGVDFSHAAAALARRNAEALGFAGRAAFFAGDWAQAISGTFDLILSNPPYIPAAEIAGLMPEVARYEPAGALAGGADGFAAYRAIFAALPRTLAPNGTAVLEFGLGQAQILVAMARDAGFACSTRCDLNGIERAAVLTRDK